MIKILYLLFCQLLNLRLGSFLGNFWYSCPLDLYSYLGEIGNLGSYLRDMDFSFCLWCCCCLLSNSITCCASILLFIVVSSCFLYLLYKVSLSSSSLDWDIKIVLLVVLVFGWFSFLRETCIGFRGLLFLMNLSLKLSLLLLSFWSHFACFFLSCDSAPFNGNYF